MCTELILAIFYLIILLIINFFLFRVLKTYFQDIIYFIKIKKITEFLPTKNLEMLIFLHEKKLKDSEISFTKFCWFRYCFFRNHICILGH